MTEEKKCLAVTSNGDSCNNKAIWPEEDPKACHIKAHQEQVARVEEEPKDAGLKKEPKEEPVDQKHIFASQHLNHTIFVRYPEEDRDYFRAEFNGGRFETEDNEKAKLLMESINSRPKLKNKITKVQ